MSNDNKPAAAQEAVAEVGRWHREMNLTAFGKGDEWRAQQMLSCPHGRFATAIEAYLAAPVAAAPTDEDYSVVRASTPAAPVDLGAQALYMHLLDMLGAKNHIDAGRIIAELHASSMSTPAAPGIDLTTAIRNCCEAEKADPDHPDTICINVNELTAILQQCVIDASPKGGTDAREQFEVWAGAANYNLFRFEASGNYQYATTVCAWQAWQAAMQATSAEVGA